MQIVELTAEQYKNWDTFCAGSDDAWFWHTTSWLELLMANKPAMHPVDRSFFLEKNGAIVACMPLLLESGITKTYTFNGGYGMTPALHNTLSDKERKTALGMIMDEVFARAKKDKIKKVMFRFPVLNEAYQNTCEQTSNYLRRFGFVDTSIQTQALNLTQSLETIRNNMRHGHKSDVTKANNIMTFEVYDGNSFSQEVFNAFVVLYHKASAPVIKPKTVFESYAAMLQSNRAFLVAAKKDETFVGFALFHAYKNKVYYGSAANDPDFITLPIGQGLQWKAIKYMKKHGYTMYELGWQHYGPAFGDNPSEKEIAISSFKRGFGGSTIPLFRGVKYFDKNLFKSEMEEYLTTIEKTI